MYANVSCQTVFVSLIAKIQPAQSSAKHVLSTAQHSAAQHSTAQHSAAQHSTAQHRHTKVFVASNSLSACLAGRLRASKERQSNRLDFPCVCCARMYSCFTGHIRDIRMMSESLPTITWLPLGLLLIRLRILVSPSPCKMITYATLLSLHLACAAY